MTWNRLNQTWHYVEKWASERPDAQALVFGEEMLTWREFKQQMDAVAMAYLEAGIEKGDRVALLSMARNAFLSGSACRRNSPLRNYATSSMTAAPSCSSPSGNTWETTWLKPSRPCYRNSPF